MVSGVKSVNGTIGVTQNVKYEDCSTVKGNEVTTIFEQAEAAGLSTGVVSTARITHATPAAAYAKTANRDIENDSQLTDADKAGGCKDIAAQLIDWPVGNGFEVILGGGRANFMLKDQADPEAADKTGSRTDGRDLVVPVCADDQRCAAAGRQQQNPHDALAVHAPAVATHLDLR